MGFLAAEGVGMRGGAVLVLLSLTRCGELDAVQLSVKPRPAQGGGDQ